MKTQNEAVLSRLRRGPITAHQALRELGVARLAARIRDLKDQGHQIASVFIEAPSRHGTARVAQYSLQRAGR